MSVFGSFKLDGLEWQGPVLVVPGLRGSGPGHWQSLWERRYPCFRRVQQDDWNTPDLDRWARRIVETALQLDEPVLVVAHSFGCLAAVRAEGFQSDLIAGSLLVAPANPERFGIEQRLSAKPLLQPSILVASTNDPWMPLERAHHWAGRWGSELVDLGAQGHINADSGLGEWAEGRRLMHRLCRRMTRQSASSRRTTGQYAPLGFAF
ncbi:MAG: alpha/beta hydrolase [Nevskia sp.]|nr:alpha/beta hydrolase [Nevskia sp.]